MSNHVIHITATVPVPDDFQRMSEAMATLSPLWMPLKAAAEALGGSTTFDFVPAGAPRAANGQQPRRRRGRPPRHTTVHTEATQP